MKNTLLILIALTTFTFGGTSILSGTHDVLQQDEVGVDPYDDDSYNPSADVGVDPYDDDSYSPSADVGVDPYDEDTYDPSK